jgi:hypothetical protein
MTTTAAYALYSGQVEVAEVVRLLNGAGFANDQICLMFAPAHPVATMVRHANLLHDQRETTAATAEWIDWLSEFGAVVIPTVGFFIHSQAFLRVLLLAPDTPALCGGSFRTLAGLGFPDHDAERFEARLQRAGYLVYVASAGNRECEHALDLFRLTGAEESATLQKDAVAQGAA